MLLCVIGPAAPAGAAAAPANEPRAWILVDDNTGEVLAAKNERERIAPASLTKMLTALVVTDHLKGNANVAISPNAARMPASKLDVKAGEQWPKEVLLHALLMSSANDAAVALAEASAGNLAEFTRQRSQAAVELGLSDNPLFNDPAGLDDAVSSNQGGDLVSARDLAIVSRAVLANPELAPIVSRKRFDFTAPNGTRRYVLNHNRLLGSYAGAMGVKTGWTSRARHTYAGAAERDGRKLLVVTLDAPNPYVMPRKLLDDGFSGAAAGTGERLPLRTLASRTGEGVGPVTSSAGAAGVSNPYLATMAVALVIALMVRSYRRYYSGSITGRMG